MFPFCIQSDVWVVRTIVYLVMQFERSSLCSAKGSELKVMCRLMVVAGVKRNRQQQRNLQDLENLEEFARSCIEITFHPPLGPKEAKFLEGLQAERPF